MFIVVVIIDRSRSRELHLQYIVRNKTHDSSAVVEHQRIPITFAHSSSTANPVTDFSTLS